MGCIIEQMTARNRRRKPSNRQRYMTWRRHTTWRSYYPVQHARRTAANARRLAEMTSSSALEQRPTPSRGTSASETPVRLVGRASRHQYHHATGTWHQKTCTRHQKTCTWHQKTCTRHQKTCCTYENSSRYQTHGTYLRYNHAQAQCDWKGVSEVNAYTRKENTAG